MGRPKAKAPARRYHISGQSVVTLGGRDYYLGPHDSPESIARYAVLISIYQQNGLAMPVDFDASSLDRQAAALLGQSATKVVASNQTNQPITVRHVTASYRELIKTRYAENRTETERLTGICNDLERHDGDLIASDYGPLRLQAQRQRWVESGKGRKYVNRLVSAVVRIWKHAVSQELIDTTCWERLRSVEPLRIGQTTAHETEPVRPVDIAVVRATAEHLTPVVKAMLRIQVATGMRPSEVCRMRPCDIDRSGPVWIYRPKRHKTAAKGKTREIPIVGDARDAITDYLQREPDGFCFSPRESLAWVLSKRSSERVTPVKYGNRPGTNRKAKPDRQPGDCFDHRGYRQAIQRAAKRAGVAVWHPYQLRHLAASAVREALGIEHAQAVLGHAQASMSQHYAKLSLAKAIEAAAAAPKL